VAFPDFAAQGQCAHHISQRATAADDDGSLSMPGALENQPDDESYPFTTVLLEPGKPAPPRPQRRMHRAWQD